MHLNRRLGGRPTSRINKVSFAYIQSNTYFHLCLMYGVGRPFATWRKCDKFESDTSSSPMCCNIFNSPSDSYAFRDTGTTLCVTWFNVGRHDSCVEQLVKILFHTKHSCKVPGVQVSSDS